MTLTSVHNSHSHEYDCRNDPVFYFKAIVIEYLGLCHSKDPLSWVNLWVDMWHRWMSCRKTHLQVSSLEISSRMAKWDGTSSSQTSFAVKGSQFGQDPCVDDLVQIYQLPSVPLALFWKLCYCVVLCSYTINPLRTWRQKEWLGWNNLIH